MRYLLDANACARYINGRSPRVRSRITQPPPSNIAVCAIMRAELRFGAHNSQNPARSLAEQDRFLNRFVSLLFDDAAAEIYGRIRFQLKRAGTPIGPNDLLIASIALANGLILVTHNGAEFGRVSGLALEDWE